MNPKKLSNKIKKKADKAYSKQKKKINKRIK